MVHGDNGFTYPAGDVAQLAAHLETLIKNSELRKSMGIRSLARIREWDFERCVTGILAALDSLGK